MFLSFAVKLFSLWKKKKLSIFFTEYFHSIEQVNNQNSSNPHKSEKKSFALSSLLILS